MKSVTISKHPLVAHKLNLLRDTTTKPKQVRELVHEIGHLLMYEVTADMALRQAQPRESPLATYQGQELQNRVGLIPVLRSGLGLVDAALAMLPMAQVLHLGIYREETSLQPVEYYNKLPSHTSVDECIVLDPVVATGGTAIATANILKDWGVSNIKFVCVCASQDGLDAFVQAHPDVAVFAGCVDQGLDSKGFVSPGTGDLGDRLFNAVNH
ncbi:hypothetical protein IWQ62_000298 [Dispira parvispora]|uniref:uracil phosphoribosyltransferase n=1 Tax=Dispira parvispora TaxID=1520584 RepID=A0A9W8B0G7_9FUNG|nr:hypothetical protein IWQ62_000298 [Dispira parvispora]